MATAEPAPHTQVLKNHEEADVVIIGAGFTGLSAALHLALAGQSVLVLDAGDIGWGASGRNGGQVNPAFEPLPSAVRAFYGTDRGDRVLKFVDGACDLVFELIERHGIKCAPRRVPYLRGASGRRGLNEVAAWVREWQDFGAPVALKSAGETKHLLGSPYYDGAMEDARGGSLQPLSYVRGLARAALAAGARVFTRSRATALEKTGSSWQVTTESGHEVKARHVLVCTNGYTDHLWPGLAQNVVPATSLQTATEPLPENIKSAILPFGHHVSETHRVMVYYRIDENGRFQIGGRGNSLFSKPRLDDTFHLRARAIKIFPGLADVRWDFNWGGQVAMTKTHLPHLIELGENAHAGFGYNGRGVAMGTAMGRQLAQLVLGEDVPMPRTRGVPFRLHAFRDLGIAWHTISGGVADWMETRTSK